MSDTMNEEIREAIEKNLPSTVGATLQKALQAGSEAIEKVKTLESRIQEAQKENFRLRELELKSEDLASREKEVSAQELRLEVTLLTKEIEFRDSRQGYLDGLVMKIFGHPNVQVPVTTSYTDGAGNVQTNNMPHNQVSSKD